MIKWHYQIMKHPDGIYKIHELYTSGDGTTGYTVDGIYPMGETPEELIEDLKMMLKDAKKHGVKDYE